MIKFQLILVSIIIFSLNIKCQNFPKKFRDISIEEFNDEEIAIQNTADAVVLFDKGLSYFGRKGESFEIIFVRKTRIKILNESGKKWSVIEIPYYQEGSTYEKVMNIEAYTYNVENGVITTTKLDPSQTYDDKIDNRWNLKKFALPNVKEGSIIEFAYTVISPYMFNLHDWKFQWQIPVIYSEYMVKLTPFYEYTYLLQGANKFDNYDSYVELGSERQFGNIKFRNMVHKFSMKNVTPFNDESYITTISDYIIKLDFQLSKINYPNGPSIEILTTWDKLIKKLNKSEDFGKYVNKSEKKSSKLIDVNTISAMPENDKFNFILNYVKDNYKWYGEMGKFATKSANNFIKDKQGNVAEINLFTIGLLRSVGINANPVITSTRKHGKIAYDYPYSHFFNYVIIIAEIDGKQILSDATEPKLKNNRIPPRCLNDQGLVIDENKMMWVDLVCKFPSKKTTTIITDVTNPSRITSEISTKTTEYEAFENRQNYGNNIEEIKTSLDNKNYNIIESSITSQNSFKYDKPYILDYKIEYVPEIINNKIYLTAFHNEIIKDNPLKQKSRTYPIDMTYPLIEKLTNSISIPEGYVVDYLPKQLSIKTELFELSFVSSKANDKIILNLDYYFKKSVYSAEEYTRIKHYFSEIIKIGNEKVVLKKTATN